MSIFFKNVVILIMSVIFISFLCSCANTSFVNSDYSEISESSAHETFEKQKATPSIFSYESCYQYNKIINNKNQTDSKTPDEIENLRQQCEEYEKHEKELERIGGGMNDDIIRRILLEHLPMFKNCYQSVLNKSTEAFKGVIVLDFIIGPLGAVTKAEVEVKNQVLPHDLRKCFLSVLEDIKFPESSGGGIVGVRQPINLFPNTLTSKKQINTSYEEQAREREQKQEEQKREREREQEEQKQKAEKAREDREREEIRIKKASLHLEIGITQEKVYKLIGTPDRAEVRTCRPDTKERWTCKSLWFGNLEIILQTYRDGSGKWVVNSWSFH